MRIKVKWQSILIVWFAYRKLDFSNLNGTLIIGIEWSEVYGATYPCQREDNSLRSNIIHGMIIRLSTWTSKTVLFLAFSRDTRVTKKQKPMIEHRLVGLPIQSSSIWAWSFSAEIEENKREWERVLENNIECVGHMSWMKGTNKLAQHTENMHNIQAWNGQVDKTAYQLTSQKESLPWWHKVSSEGLFSVNSANIRWVGTAANFQCEIK